MWLLAVGCVCCLCAEIEPQADTFLRGERVTECVLCLSITESYRLTMQLFCQDRLSMNICYS
jgi:hypothetical protein